MSVVLVYVPKPSTENLEIGLQQSVWGWKAATVAKADTREVLQGLKEGDHLLLAHCGITRKKQDPADVTIGRLIVTRVIGEAFEDVEPIWPDEVYLHRIRFDVVGEFEGVNGTELGADAVEALRYSSTKQGSPIPVRAPDAVNDALIHLSQQRSPYLADDADTVEERYLELPAETDRLTRAMTWAEQRTLRRRKFKGRTEITCALCGRRLPAGFVRAAHIKKRSECDHAQRSDLANIMGACLLGCDELYERGHLYIDEDGWIRASSARPSSPDLDEIVSRLTGRRCAAAGEESAPYFAWHREKVAEVA